MNNQIFTLWLGPTNPICRLCMKSWKKLGYEITIYTDLADHDSYIDEFKLLDYRTVSDMPTNDILPFSDLFRYKRLYEYGGIWVDADMFLIKRLPPNAYIISSERTAQKGAYKRTIEEIPNIGVLKFPPKCSLLGHVIMKIEKSRSKSKKIQKNMFIFQDAILSTFPTWQDEVAEAQVYCPANWSSVKEIYYNTTFTSKYGQAINQPEDIIENSIGVHLWENLSLNKYKIDFKKVHKDSLFSKLNRLV